MSNIVPWSGSPLIAVAASNRIACYSDGNYSVVRQRDYANAVATEEVLFTGRGIHLCGVHCCFHHQPGWRRCQPVVVQRWH